MDAKTVCLGLLSFGEASGYDLKKHVESSGDYFFATGFGSIYPALAALASKGLIERSDACSGGRKDRKAYRITPAGRSELRQRLAMAEPRHTLRSELLALLYFSHLVTPERVTQVIDERLAAMLAEVHASDNTESSLKHPRPSRAQFVDGLRTALIETTLRYTRENRKLLDA